MYINYLLCKKAIKQSTIARKARAIKSLLKHGIDVNDPDMVVRFLNESPWANGSKDIAIDAYRDFLKMLGFSNVHLPKFKIEDKYPFIPLESEIDSIVSSTRVKMSSFLRLLKDTAARPLEAWRLKWIDIDITNRNVTISPAKYSYPRKLRISEQTLNMLLSMPRKNQYVFSVNARFEEELEHFTRNYQKVRNRLANKLQNPRLRQISLRTFRHWKATTEYAKTKDIIHVKELLGHKSISNTMKYVHIANVMTDNEDNYTCKTAKNVAEASELVQSGFEYVTEIDNVKLFRKRK